MFSTRFVDSVARVEKHSQINDSMPFRHVSKMCDSKMSSKGSILGKDSLNHSYVMDNGKKREKRIEDYDLGDLVAKFMMKDSICLEKESVEIVKKPPLGMNPTRSNVTKYVPAKKPPAGVLKMESVTSQETNCEVTISNKDS
jgi:hypothetical protein